MCYEYNCFFKRTFNERINGVKQGDLCHNYKSSNKNDYRKLNLIVIGIQSSIHSHYLDLKQYNVVFTLEQGKVQG